MAAGFSPWRRPFWRTRFPPQKRGLAFALYGITAIMAPTIGPTLGGWITFNYSWRWIFFINLPVGICTCFWCAAWSKIRPTSPASRAPASRIDYIGIALLALGVGALQILLDKGQEDDWFGSHFIITLAIVSAVCLISLVVWEWYHKDAHHRRAHVQEFQLRQRPA